MIKTIDINGNITLSYIPVEKVKTTAVSMYIHRPLIKEEASKNALLPHIMKRGCGMCRNTIEIAHYLENLYGAKFSAGIAKRGDDHLLCFDFETISDKYAPEGEKLTYGVTKFMLAMVFDPLAEFDGEVFEQERSNSIVKIKNIINDKRVYANYRCQSEMAKGDSYAVNRLGYVEDMEKLTPGALYDYYKKIVVSSKIDIFVCGITDIDEIERQIRESVSHIVFEEAHMPKSHILTVENSNSVKNVTEKMNVTQGKLSMGFLTGTGADDDDYFALAVANAIYGGGAQSKLFNNVREKLSLAYYAGSFVDKYKGFMMVNAGIEFENYEKAYSEILAQLEEMKRGNISDAEFESSKGFIINSLNAAYDDQGAMISFYLNNKISGTNSSLEEYKEKIAQVTKEDVCKVMEKITLNTVYFLERGEN